MSLAHPPFLLLLAVPVGLAILFRWFGRRYARDLARFAETGLQPRLVCLETVRRERRWQVGLNLAAAFALVLAALGPQWGRQWREMNQEGAAVIFALDTSRSMLANDFAPSRLERAKMAIAEILPRLRGDRVGLVLFAGSSFLQVPPTSDYAAFGMALEAVGVNSIPRGGTAIGQAIATAADSFRQDGSASKVLFVISDGENHEGDPVSQAKKAAGEGITICAIGVGSEAGELIPIKDESGNLSYLKDDTGQVVKSSLNQDILKEIARVTGGGYIRATNLSFGLEDLYRQTLRGMQKTRYASKWREQRLDRYQAPLLLAIILLAAEMLVGRVGNLRRGKGNACSHTKSV